MDKIENSNSYVALLYGTMAAAIVTAIFYLMQIVKDGSYNYDFDADWFKDLFLFFMRKEKDEDAPEPARSLMSVKNNLESLLHGMARVFPALIVLTLAWASGSLMRAVGADRLFSSWIVGGISPEALPTLSFLISLFMALATGKSRGPLFLKCLVTSLKLTVCNDFRNFLGHHGDPFPTDYGPHVQIVRWR